MFTIVPCVDEKAIIYGYVCTCGESCPLAMSRASIIPFMTNHGLISHDGDFEIDMSKLLT
jgi:hypothetical protein